MRTYHEEAQKAKALAEEFIAERPDLLGSALAGTGHRPNKFGGYNRETTRKLVIVTRSALEVLRPSIVISGMALGYDTALALAALDLGIPLTAAVPYAGQEEHWIDEEDKILYREILTLAQRVHIVEPGGYEVWKLDSRNRWMVDHAKYLLAIHDGTKGGTMNCLNYAKKRIPSLNLWPSIQTS